jgi:hypothetical protein
MYVCLSVGLGALFAIIFAAKFTRWHTSVLMSDQFTALCPTFDYTRTQTIVGIT